MKKIILAIASILIFCIPNFAHADITTGLMGWYKFNDGSGNYAADSSGNSYTGTLEGGTPPIWYNSYCAKPTLVGCIVFSSGAAQYVDMGNNFNFTTGDFTLSAWIYLDDYNTNEGGQGPIIFFKGQYETDGYYVQLSNTNGSPSLATNQSGVSNFVLSSQSIPTNSWNQLVVTRSGSTVLFYLNGTLMTGISGTISDPQSSSEDFEIGGYDNNLITMDGDVQDARIYNRALTSSDVAQLYAYPVSAYPFYNFIVKVGRTFIVKTGKIFSSKSIN